ncbi:hypothetical protein Srufu_014670 [Streptomyces libani subsp. rufus]|nr:hypothetical protein Srufu_014670 [Streptomyces libani subsp. rufus]
MNDELGLAPTPGPLTAGLPTAGAATPAEGAGIIRLRSEYVLSEPMDKEWIRRCTAELAPRLAPGDDARAYVIDVPDGSMAASALGLIHRVLPAPSSPGGWQAACTWSPHTRMPGAAATPEPLSARCSTSSAPSP